MSEQWERLNAIAQEEEKLFASQREITSKLSALAQERSKLLEHLRNLNNTPPVVETSTETIANGVDIAAKNSKKEAKLKLKEERRAKKARDLEERNRAKEERKKSRAEAEQKRREEETAERKRTEAEIRQKAADEVKRKVQEELAKLRETQQEETSKKTAELQKKEEDLNIKEQLAQVRDESAKQRENKLKELERLKKEKEDLEAKKEDRRLKTRSMILSGPMGIPLGEKNSATSSILAAATNIPDGTEPICQNCNKAVLRTQATVRACGNTWHRSCFRCGAAGCSKFISSLTCVEIDHKPYCKEHGEEIKKRGAVASLPVPQQQQQQQQQSTSPSQTTVQQSSTVTSSASSASSSDNAKDKCSKCGKPFEEGSSRSIDNVPYCKEHYDEFIRNLSAGASISSSSSADSNSSSSSPSPTNDLSKSDPIPKATAGVSVIGIQRRGPTAAANALCTVPDWGSKSEGRSRSVIVRGTSTAASRFTAQQEKCDACGKTVYAVDKIAADGKIFHKPCLRCIQCDKVLKLGNYASLEGKFYCKPHFKQLFMSKGNYSEGFGKQKLTHEWAEKKGKEVDPVII
jgi:chemotaxis protein histidine kinase CheA